MTHLLRQVPKDEWTTRTIDGTSDSTHWLPICMYSDSVGNSHAYGVLPTGEWTWAYADGIRIAAPGNVVGALTLLELSHRDAVALLRAGIRRRGLPDHVMYAFPLDELLLFALRQSAHWAGFAERWIDNGYPLSERLAEAIPRNSTVKRWQGARMRERFPGEGGAG